jgi:hypothetical protein
MIQGLIAFIYLLKSELDSRPQKGYQLIYEKGGSQKG